MISNNILGLVIFIVIVVIGAALIFGIAKSLADEIREKTDREI